MAHASYGQQISRRSSSQRSTVQHYPGPPGYNKLRAEQLLVQRPASRRPNNSNRYNATTGRRQGLDGPSPMQRKTQKPWANWPQVQVKLYNLRPDETTWNIYRNFAKQGDILFIDLSERLEGQRNRYGKIKFSAGVEDFWQSQSYQMLAGNGKFYTIRVELVNERGRDFQMTSPIRPHITYPQVMPLFPTKLHFGLMVNPESMMSHHTIDRSNSLKNLKFVVDAFRKRFTAEFVVNNQDPRHEPGSNFICARPVGELDRVNTYKFQIPFDQLKIIREVPASGGTFRLVLSLSSPPQFNRKREADIDCHSPDGLQWSEFDDGWYRQTDIVYDPYSLTAVPIALHKDRPVIDIGNCPSLQTHNLNTHLI
jgi:RNA-dependent RNA polymerase